MPKRRWEATYARDGYRCMAPGCTARATIEDHHIVYRSDRGSDSLWNQLSSCAFHHRQGEHGQYARIRGTAPLGVIWRIGSKSLATWWKNERRLTHGSRGRARGASRWERRIRACLAE